MVQKYIYETGYRSFNEDWRPHAGCSDMWGISALLWQPDIPEEVYAFGFSLFRIQTGLQPFVAVRVSLKDILEDKIYHKRWKLPLLKDQNEHLHFDEESILFRDKAQLMFVKDAIGFRSVNGSFQTDLCMVRQKEEVWFGNTGKMPLRENGKKGLYQCFLPSMDVTGTLCLESTEMKLTGKAVFERTWGKYPVTQAKSHWEHFYMFFDDGREVALSAFPYGHFQTGMFVASGEEDASPHMLTDYTLETTDYLEIDEWRFSCGWKLQIPEWGDEAYSLYPMVENQFQLPIAHPILGIFDSGNNLCGYAFSELMPGAKNELNYIGTGLYRKY